MRFYGSYTSHDLKTVRAQGLRIAKLWSEQRTSEVWVKRIVRSVASSKTSPSGFVILESIFEQYLCHYTFSSGSETLIVSSESSLNASQEGHLECPEYLLKATPVVNSGWRGSVEAYEGSVGTITRDIVQSDATIFLRHPLSGRQYAHEFVLLKVKDGDWYGVDEDGSLRYLSIDLSTIHQHGGRIIDPDQLSAIPNAQIVAGSVMDGQFIYRLDQGVTHLLGRTQTRGERTQSALSTMPAFSWAAQERPFWM